MLGLLCRSVAPALRVSDAIRRWQDLRHRLAEPPRKRRSQRSTLSDILS
jgi:hypothetical protein